MSGADEESSAETYSTKSSSSSRKSLKPKKSEKKRSDSNTKTNPFGMRIHPGSAADHGYTSGGSQGYVSSHTTGYNSSGYETEYPSLRGEEEITHILQHQTLSDPPETSLTYPPAANQHYSSLTNHMPPSSHMMNPNVKASRQRGGGLAMPAGRNIHANPPLLPAYQHPQHHHYSQSRPNPFPHSFQSCPSSQSGLSPLLPQEPHPHSAIIQMGINNENSPPINPHHGTSSQEHPSNLLDPRKQTETASSGYSSFRGYSPPKAGSVSRKSPSDDGSVIAGSLRSSLLTNSYSTFSSNSSRLSSPCSNSGRSDTMRQHLQSPLPPQFMVQRPPPGPKGESGYNLKHSLRVNSYPSKPNAAYLRRHSDVDELSERSWNTYSSQSSHYSYELSDEQLDSLPMDIRRNSFSKNQPLPLPESMQHDFSGVGMEYGLQNGDPNASYLNEPSPMQIGVNDIHDSNDVHAHLTGTLPLRHFDVDSEMSHSFPSHPAELSPLGGLFDQGPHGTNTYIFDNSQPTNMVVGNMASFASSLPEETQYLENLLHSQVK